MLHFLIQKSSLATSTQLKPAPQAIALYNQVLEIDERIGDIQTKAATLHQLAIIYALRGDVDDAIALLVNPTKHTKH